jgi:hypothetical protein
MRVVFAIYLFIHGFSHLVGFIVPWKIAKLEDAPYTTRILAGVFEIGDTGIRIVGIFWLITALVFIILALVVITQTASWSNPLLLTTIFSFLLCLIGLPDAKIGLIANGLVLIFLLINNTMNWLS